MVKTGRRRSPFLIIYWILQWTWGIIQNVIGLLVWLILGREGKESFCGASVRKWNIRGSMTLGMFIMMDRKHGHDVLVHEYGHTIQSIILGPLYLLVIGLPSLLWAGLKSSERYRQKKHRSYYWLYCERWANHLGERCSGMPSPVSKI
ncbi:MAG: hypothetical protein II748_05135 [Clostridia bacterium]|nr:hypothetical protein [Clostridia bacterium]